MCYTGSCQYERFNPVTGDCHCHRGKNPCPAEVEDTINCPYCEEEIQDPTDGMNCPHCNATIHL